MIELLTSIDHYLRYRAPSPVAYVYGFLFQVVVSLFAFLMMPFKFVIWWTPVVAKVLFVDARVIGIPLLSLIAAYLTQPLVLFLCRLSPMVPADRAWGFVALTCGYSALYMYAREKYFSCGKKVYVKSWEASSATMFVIAFLLFAYSSTTNPLNTNRTYIYYFELSEQQRTIAEQTGRLPYTIKNKYKERELELMTNDGLSFELSFIPETHAVGEEIFWGSVWGKPQIDSYYAPRALFTQYIVEPIGATLNGMGSSALAGVKQFVASSTLRFTDNEAYQQREAEFEYQRNTKLPIYKKKYLDCKKPRYVWLSTEIAECKEVERKYKELRTWWDWLSDVKDKSLSVVDKCANYAKVVWDVLG
ncbi:hypothetical protein [Agarivorans sp. DSG3-1]|uniref:hypothetical protein n=1 Tax=Agarivorans sp. DSG3-1 TaxID=3342249 RepID=UPI00398E6A84